MDIRIHDYIESHCSTDEAKEYLRLAFTSEPSRSVGAHAKNNLISFIYNPKLNGVTYSVESQGPERSLLIRSLHDDNVLWIIDQPPAIEIKKYDRNEKLRSVIYTPDALILTKRGPKLVEAKGLENLVKLCSSEPLNWIQTHEGKYHFVPGDNYSKRTGIDFGVYAYNTADQILIRNLEYLLWSRDSADRNTVSASQIETVFSDRAVYFLDSLVKRLGLPNLTPVLRAIDQGLLFVNLNTTLLADQTSVIVGRSSGELEQFESLYQEQATQSFPSVSKISRDVIADRRGQNVAIERLSRIAAGESSRTTRRHKQLVAAGAAEGITPIQSLTPKLYKSGNRSMKRDSAVISFVNTFIQEHYPTGNFTVITRAYAAYCDLAKIEHPNLDPVSGTTFRTRVKKIPQSTLAKARGGVRAQNAAAPSTPPSERSLKASAAWEVAHIDHYLVDDYVILHRTKKGPIVTRLWLTALIDQNSRKVLSARFSMRPPNRLSISRAIRGCGEQHGRLPREIIADRGSDFKSAYFASLMSHFGITLSIRPTAKPKAGSEIEGLFSEFRSEYLSQRPGFIKSIEGARGVDGDRSPRICAALEVIDLIREFDDYLSWRDDSVVVGSDSSIEFKFAKSTQHFPFVGIEINKDDSFDIHTALEFKKYTIDPSKGINLQNRWYSPNDQSLLPNRKCKREVRLDPDNPHKIFVLTENDWAPWYSPEAKGFASLHPHARQAQIITKFESFNMLKSYQLDDDVELAKLIRKSNETIKARAREATSQTEKAIVDEFSSSPYAKLPADAFSPITT